MPEPSILDARLAEIDRRLRSIQSGLRPVDGEPGPEGADDFEGADDLEELGLREELAPPPPVLLRAAPAPDDDDDEPPELDGLPGPTADQRVDELAERLSHLTDAHERLLELHRELLSQYAELLEVRAADTAALAVTAGPFHSTAAVHAFEQSVSALPGVSSVSIREFVGDERVQVDVRVSATDAG